VQALIVGAREILFTIIAFIVAASVPPIIGAFIRPPSGTYDINSIFLAITLFYPFSAAFVVLLGLPAFLILRPFRPGRWWSVAAVGFVLGVLVAIILRLPRHPNPNDFLIDGPLGSLSVLVFWWIWRRGAATPASGAR
jgi:hypothetical protein